jgi:hypothetical protein
MASLSRGTNIDISTQVTSQTLHNLIEHALVSGISASDLIAGTHFVSVGTATPNPSSYPIWYSNDYDDPILRVYARPWNVWLAVGPDRFEIPLLNSAATTVAMGCLVVANGASDFTLATSPSLNALGFAQATIAAGAYGPVATCGIGWVLHISSVSAGTQSQGPTAGDGLRAYGCPAGGIYGVGLSNNGGSGPFFGMFLENNRSGASGSYSRFRAHIWGPKMTTAIA